MSINKERQTSRIDEDIQDIRKKLDKAFDDNSELELLRLIKEHPILLSTLYYRRFGSQPVFAEIAFGSEYKCDFLWLNDNSDGPEWTIVEIEKPKMKLFSAKHDPSASLTHAIGQLDNWRRFFERNKDTKSNLFKAVSRFRWILVAGSVKEWKLPYNAQWRADYNRNNKIEIRTSDVFYKSLDLSLQDPTMFEEFERNSPAGNSAKLKEYVEAYEYLRQWDGYGF